MLCTLLTALPCQLTKPGGSRKEIERGGNSREPWASMGAWLSRCWLLGLQTSKPHVQETGVARNLALTAPPELRNQGLLPHPLKLPACLDARCSSVYSGTFFPFSSTTHQAPHEASSGSSSFLTKREVFQFSTQLWQLAFANARITDYGN